MPFVYATSWYCTCIKSHASGYTTHTQRCIYIHHDINQRICLHPCEREGVRDFCTISTQSTIPHLHY